MPSSDSLRDDTLAYTMDKKKRKQILKEILAVEEEELGVYRVPSVAEEQARAKHQQRYAERIAQPLRPAATTHTNYLRCPRTLRGKGNRSLDVLFSTNRGEDGTFWLYGTQKVSQSTLGSLATATPPSMEDIRKSAIGASLRRQIDAIMATAATKERCGLIFDLISTSKIIASGAPHEVGAFIYHYIEGAHYDKVGLKFVFVGITDNVNCCAARDVFCRDDIVAGHYVGDTKRPFEALDNVHMYTVFPGHRVHPFSRIGGPLSKNNNTTTTTASGGDDCADGGASPGRPCTSASGSPSPIHRKRLGTASGSASQLRRPNSRGAATPNGPRNHTRPASVPPPSGGQSAFITQPH